MRIVINYRPVTFWQLAEDERPAIIRSGLLGAAGALTKVSQAVLVLAVLREGAGSSPSSSDGLPPVLWLLLAALATITVLGELLTRQASTTAHFADIRFSQSLRQRQITHLRRLPLDWFSRNGSGRVKKFVQDDVFRVHELIAHLVPDLAASVITPLASLVLLLCWDPWLAVVALVPLLLATAALPMVLRGRSERADDYERRLGDLNAAVVEFVRGIEPIKLFGDARQGHRRFGESSRALARAYQDWVRATQTGFALMGAFTSPAFALAIMALGGAAAVAFLDTDPMLVIPALILVSGIAAPVSLAVGMIQKFRESGRAATDLEEFFALRPQPATGEHDDPPDRCGVEIDSVGFRYPGGPRALDGVTVRLGEGSLTALVGPSGSGKSTLAALLPRLIDPDEGAVRLGGTDLRSLSGRSLYSNVAFVFQQPYLFRMSIRDNIALTRPDASTAEVETAARAAQIHDTIVALPRGYDTVIGIDSELSGGQQQRLSIARALVTAAPILVLDEATAYADPDSEAAVQRALSALTRGRTILAIAHRLHTITDADQIVVLEGGRAVETGSHHELIARDGHYARLWASYSGARSWMSEVG